MGMKQILVMMAAVVLVGCVKKAEPFTDPIVENAVRDELKKRKAMGELTEADLEKVTDLDISGTQVTDASLKEVAKLQNLERLHLSGTQITDEGLKEVAKLQKLIVLSLATKITDEGLVDVAKLQKLTLLNLSRTQVTDAGLKDVAKLQKLTDLILSRTQITDAGLKDVAKLKQLERLSLTDTQITDEGLVDVAKLQNLKSLILNRTKITKAGVAKLKKALPNCQIDDFRFNAEDLSTTTAESSKKFTEKDVVGTYQMNLPNGLFTMRLLKDGKSILVHTTNAGEKKPETGKWKIEDGNLFLIGNDETGIMKINPDRSLSPIAEIKNGLREDWDPKVTSVVSFKKIK